MSAPTRSELLAAALQAIVAPNNIEGALGTIRTAAGPAAEAVARSVLEPH